MDLVMGYMKPSDKISVKSLFCEDYYTTYPILQRSHKSSFLMRIVHNLALFALLSGICTSRQKAKNMEKLLNLPKEILPDMEGQLSTQGIREISKMLKV